MYAESGPNLSAPFTAPLIWLGGGNQRELTERHEQATHAVAGLIVSVNAVLAWLLATAAVAGATQWPPVAVFAAALPCGVLVGAVSRMVATGPPRSWRSLMGRIAVALAIGMLVAELAGLAVFAGSIDRRLDQLAVRDADSTPAVTLAAADLDRARSARSALDDTVDQARRYRDDALVVARCEYHPTPDCPQTQITGVPGDGPETRTAEQLLADAQQELDRAVAIRDRRAFELDGNIAASERTLTQAREAVTAAADRGLGARWAAMNDYTRDQPGALLLRVIMVAVFTLLTLLPLVFKLWRGETTQDRQEAARAEVDRAELEAKVAIAVKRAEVRTAAEMLWAEQQLASARLAAEAQTRIEEERQRQRIAEALEEPVAAPTAELPAAPAADHLPALPDSGSGPQRVPSPVPVIPDIARTAARWIRPLVPPLVARAIDTTIRPIRAVHQVFEGALEEVEEITFTLKRTRKVNVGSLTAEQQQGTLAHGQPQRVELDRVPASDPLPVLTEDRPGELSGPDGPRALASDAPRALPSDGPPALPPA